MKVTLIIAMLLSATMSIAQGKPDETTIRNILEEEVAAWNKGDAKVYSQHFAADGTFTNIRGMFFAGHQAFLDKHEEIFKSMFHGTTLRQRCCFAQVPSPGDRRGGDTHVGFRVFTVRSATRHSSRRQGTLAHPASAGDGEGRGRMENHRVPQCGCEAGSDGT